MIHDWDSHYWMARLPSGGWISAEDHASYEPIFQTANRIRIEPLSLQSAQAVLDAEIPGGYTTFLRTDRNIIVMRGPDADEAPCLFYVMAIEKGHWEEPGKACLSDIPLVDGFRAELQIFKDGHGGVDFKASDNFYYEVNKENGIDIYKFVKR
jgi:hypothetical protein